MTDTQQKTSTLSIAAEHAGRPLWKSETMMSFTIEGIELYGCSPSALVRAGVTRQQLAHHGRQVLVVAAHFRNRDEVLQPFIDNARQVAGTVLELKSASAAGGAPRLIVHGDLPAILRQWDDKKHGALGDERSVAGPMLAYLEHQHRLTSARTRRRLGTPVSCDVTS